MDIIGYDENSRIENIAQNWMNVFYNDAGNIMNDSQFNSFAKECNDSNVDSMKVLNRMKQMLSNNDY